MRFQNLSDVQRLIEQRACEVAALEFKGDAPLDTEAAKKKFLRDVTSMGNSGGGAIVFGLTADDSSGVGVAKEITPIANPALLSIMSDIVRDVVRPPLLWTPTEFEVGDGVVVVAEVMPSALGPYMVQGYSDNRFYRRGPTGVVEMTEFEVSSAYALAGRSAEHRENQWQRHHLPMKTPTEGSWLNIAALPFEPFATIFEGKELDRWQVLHPTDIERCLFGLPIHEATLRHWADGITADDSLIGRPLSFALRLHRDGAAGIIQRWEDYIDLRATARAINAYLAYLASFWSAFSLRSPVEVEVGITGIENVIATTNSFGVSPGRIVQPPGVSVSNVAAIQELLPWELQRAQVRHAFVRQFIERLSYAFDFPHNGELFSLGLLFGKGGVSYGVALAPGLIVIPHAVGSVALIDEVGRIYGGSGGIKCFRVGGAVIDEAGDTLAVVEMSDSIACPSDFIADYTGANTTPVTMPSNVPTQDQGGPTVPSPTGKWSDKSLRDALT